MDQFPPPEPPDLTLQLPRDLYYQAIHELCAGLPPPVTGLPEDRARCDNAAIAVVASLLPANGDEVTLATQSLPPGLTRWSSPPMPRRWSACGWPANTRAIPTSC
jgi:hypothetical protein